MGIDAIRDEVRAWVDEHWDLDRTLREWWALLAAAGYAPAHFPEGMGGRGYSPAASRAVADTLTDLKVIGPPFGLGQLMGAPVTLDFGTDQQQQDWVLPLASGLESWCQLFSEPGAGSDLASCQTRAVRDGDVWIVNGQKVWTSGSMTADRGMLVARTNVDAPKHRGITYFIVDMDQPGIEVRPLKQMSGAAHFSEVFFTDAVVGHDRVLGQVDAGWMVAVATLSYERQGLTQGAGGGIQAGNAGERAGDLDRSVGEVLERARSAQAEQARSRSVRSPKALAELAASVGRADDPVVRQELMRIHSLSETARISALRARAAAKAGKQPGPEISTAKLVSSELGRRARDLALGLLGPHGTLLGDDAPEGGAFQQMALSVQAGSIAGGTDEIQRNIIGERVLGLPKEPQVDRDVPFKDLAVGTRG